MAKCHEIIEPAGLDIMIAVIMMTMVTSTLLYGHQKHFKIIVYSYTPRFTHVIRI